MTDLFSEILNPAVRKAEDLDLSVLETWLREEWKKYGKGFYCNWNVIVDAHNKDELFILSVSEDIPALLANHRHQPNILEVRKNARRKGYGRLLAEFAEDNARNNQLSAMRIQCAPETSIPFWKHIGYEIVKLPGAIPRYYGTKNL